MKGIKTIVTYKSNIICCLCDYKCAPYNRGYMKVNEFRERVNKAYNDGYTDYLHIIGGEPFLNTGLLHKYLKSVKKVKALKAVQTNGFWGKTDPFLNIIEQLKRDGLQEIIFEYDYYHSLYIDSNIIEEAILKAYMCGYEISIKAVLNTPDLKNLEDSKTYEIIKLMKEKHRNVKLIFECRNKQNHFKGNEEKILLYKK